MPESITPRPRDWIANDCLCILLKLRREKIGRSLGVPESKQVVSSSEMRIELAKWNEMSQTNGTQALNSSEGDIRGCLRERMKSRRFWHLRQLTIVPQLQASHFSRTKNWTFFYWTQRSWKRSLNHKPIKTIASSVLRWLPMHQVLQ